MADRRSVNALIATWLALLAIDAFRPACDAQEELAHAVHYPLELAGLWQGPWKLFGPDVDRVNIRLSAEIAFADGATATWESPDWSQISAPRKFVRSREMNYFANVWRENMDPALDGLAAYLARTVPHPHGSGAAATTVTLFLTGALVPPVEERVVPAGPYLAFDPPKPMYQWRAP